NHISQLEALQRVLSINNVRKLISSELELAVELNHMLPRNTFRRMGIERDMRALKRIIPELTELHNRAQFAYLEALEKKLLTDLGRQNEFAEQLDRFPEVVELISKINLKEQLVVVQRSIKK